MTCDNCDADAATLVGRPFGDVDLMVCAECVRHLSDEASLLLSSLHRIHVLLESVVGGKTSVDINIVGIEDGVEIPTYERRF